MYVYKIILLKGGLRKGWEPQILNPISFLNRKKIEIVDNLKKSNSSDKCVTFSRVSVIRRKMELSQTLKYFEGKMFVR